MKYNLKTAIDMILKDFENGEVTSYRENDDHYIFSIKPKNMKGDILDNMYVFDRNTGKSFNFIMAMHSDIYKETKQGDTKNLSTI